MRVLALLVAFLAPACASAFGCQRAESIAAAIDRGDELVFKGRVVRVVPVGAEMGLVDFEISSTYWGKPSGAQQQILFGGSYETRAFKFAVGQTFLVSSRPVTIHTQPQDPPAKLPDGVYQHSDMCSLRKQVSAAASNTSLKVTRWPVTQFAVANWMPAHRAPQLDR
jgi:hypothetical protein